MHGSAVPAVLSVVDFEKVPVFAYHERISELMPNYFADHAQFGHRAPLGLECILTFCFWHTDVSAADIWSFDKTPRL